MNTEKISDQQAIEAVLGGDSSVFEVLVRRYQDRLFNSLTHLLCNSHEAEEITQDAMLKAFTKLSTFRGNSSFYTWLYRIALNVNISRKRRKRPGISLDEMQLEQGLEPSGSTNLPDAHLIQSEQIAKVHQALAELSEDFRAVLVLRELDGCDYETISEMLDIPIGTVRSRISRGRGLLRNLLQGTLGGSDLP